MPRIVDMKKTLRNLNLILFVLLALTITSCVKTVKKEPIVASVPSWSGANQNSGFLYFTNLNSGVIDSNAVIRYNLLIDKYGNKFLPPVKKNDGLVSEPPIFIIDAEHLEKFIRMNRWYKTGEK